MTYVCCIDCGREVSKDEARLVAIYHDGNGNVVNYYRCKRCFANMYCPRCDDFTMWFEGDNVWVCECGLVRFGSYGGIVSFNKALTTDELIRFLEYTRLMEVVC